MKSFGQQFKLRAFLGFKAAYLAQANPFQTPESLAKHIVKINQSDNQIFPIKAALFGPLNSSRACDSPPQAV